MNVNSKNYSEAIALRDEVTSLKDKAYGVARHLEQVYNEIDKGIEIYEVSIER